MTYPLRELRHVITTIVDQRNSGHEASLGLPVVLNICLVSAFLVFTFTSVVGSAVVHINM